jgi:hypothetical protein
MTLARLTTRSVFELAAAALFLTAAGAVRAQTTTTTPHGAFSASCAQCHLSDSWRPTKISSEFKHAPDRFPLEGAHAKASCTACHKRLDFTGISTACASCHRDMHQGELGANCGSCHTQRSFLDMAQMRRAHQLTAFPLTGLHAVADCRSCHTPRAPGQQAFVNRPTACQSCHLADYQKATNPPHVAAAFPKDCSGCHSPAGWRGTAFNHSTTQFPLTGAHRTVSCQGCHADNVYRGKPTACVSCHQKDYNNTTNPNHTSAGFATDCASCHTTTQWLGATFNHDAAFFPIYSGAHAGKWTSCATCHTTPSNFATFDCLSCHTKTQTDAKHVGRNGYVYASPNCYACHPRGRAG